MVLIFIQPLGLRVNTVAKRPIGCLEGGIVVWQFCMINQFSHILTLNLTLTTWKTCQIVLPRCLGIGGTLNVDSGFGIQWLGLWTICKDVPSFFKTEPMQRIGWVWWIIDTESRFFLMITIYLIIDPRGKGILCLMMGNMWSKQGCKMEGRSQVWITGSRLSFQAKCQFCWHIKWCHKDHSLIHKTIHCDFYPRGHEFNDISCRCKWWWVGLSAGIVPRLANDTYCSVFKNHSGSSAILLLWGWDWVVFSCDHAFLGDGTTKM